MDITVIKNEDQYQAALVALEQLMDGEPQPGSSEADQLELLSLVLKEYEDKHYDLGLPDPVDAIRFRMEQQGLKQRDLVPYLGSANRVSEVLSRKRPLNLRMIHALHKGLGIPAEALIREPSAELPTAAPIDWLKFPIGEMRKRGWFPSFRGTLANAKSRAEELISDFIRIVDCENATQALYRQADHIRSDHNLNRYSLLAWRARILHQASDDSLPVEYRPGTVTQDFMQTLAQHSWAEQGPMLARDYLHHHGIHLVVERHLPKTYLDGAAMCLKDGTPVIAITLRHDRLDNFWFTLMHELAHVALHLTDDCEPFFDDMDKIKPQEAVEQEADVMAGEVLLPNEIWQQSAARYSHQSTDVIALAQELNIHPAIIAGRIRYDTGDYRLLARYIGNNKVRPQLVN